MSNHLTTAIVLGVIFIVTLVATIIAWKRGAFKTHYPGGNGFVVGTLLAILLFSLFLAARHLDALLK